MHSGECSHSLERGLITAAILMILAGAVAIDLADWEVVGWILLVYGAMTVFLTYQLIVAPCLDDVDGDTTGLDPRDSNADFWKRWGAIPPESSSTECQLQEPAS